ncbi:MAG: nuclear transport factor 2 family protein [Pseudomonadota bacterium]
MNAQDAAARYVDFFASLRPDDLARFDDFFTPNARFRDPFNDVTGVDGIRRVFAHMYAQCPEARFEVSEIALKDQAAYLRWVFVCREGLAIEGLSRVAFAADGRAREHLDYWDPASQLYTRLPLIGSLMRWLRGRLSAGD